MEGPFSANFWILMIIFIMVPQKINISEFSFNGKPAFTPPRSFAALP
jgi:hypothetical protein